MTIFCCKSCDKEFYRRFVSQKAIKEGAAKYCSRKCFALAKRVASTSHIKVCRICGLTFNKKPTESYSQWGSKSICSRRCQSQVWVGRHHSKETILKLVSSHLGKPAFWNRREKHWNWKGGTTDEARRIRASLEYKNWRRSVFERDDFTCVECGVRGGRLNADHIQPFSRYPDLRFDINNGRTLCEPCHIKTPTFGGLSHI